MKGKLLIVYLIILCSILPLSTDMYLPAFPDIASGFYTSEYQTSLTLVFFFVFYTITSLIWGPLSDKYGRKPILIACMTVYTIGAFLCTLAASIPVMIVFRCLQAAGGGCGTTLAWAIVKEVYQGKTQQNALAVVQSMMMIGSVCAPALGALLLSLGSWQSLFYLQAFLGLAVVLIGGFCFKETLQERGSEGLIRTLGRLIVVLRTPKFALLLLIFSIPAAGTMAFVSTSTYVYQNTFGLSSQVYGLIFPVSAVGMIIGPVLCIVLKRRMDYFQLPMASFLIILGCGLACLLFGDVLPVAYALMMLVAVMFIGVVRPIAAFIMINLKKDDTGSASSLVATGGLVGGTLGTIIAPQFSFDYILGVAFVMIAAGLVSAFLWFVFFRKDEKIRSMNL